MDPVMREAAHRYSDDVQKARDLQIDAEPEAQLTTPVDNLLTTAADHAEIGELSLLREARLDGVRPDFAAVVDGFACGWIELKRPGHTLEGPKWRGREKDQWDLLAELDSLIVTDGYKAVLYSEGTLMSEQAVELPVDVPESWNPDPLISLLRLFSSTRPATVRRVSQLARKLAPLARLLRLRLLEGIEKKKPGFEHGKAAWDQAMQRQTTETSFASDVAQVLAYSMAIAGLQGGADRDSNGVITVDEASNKLHRGPHNVLAAALGPVLGIPDLMKFVRAEVGGIERLVSAIDIQAIHRHKDPRGEPWLWFYEDFLAHYDPDSRQQSGVYYTPAPVVQCQVRLVDYILKERLNRNLGFGADTVTTLDPAAGSGTYPLAVIDYAEKAAIKRRGQGGRIHAGKNLRRNLTAFEILPGPYAVAQLRIGQRLAEMLDQYSEVTEQYDDLQVYMTDTLEDPTATSTQPGLFGDALVLSEQADKARALKHGRQVTVVIGNPPYDRVTKDDGGWVTNPSSGRRLFDDISEPAKEVIFSEHASLYNMYIYFWRWALWKAFEEHSEEAAVVSFIAPSKWLNGPVYLGLRRLARSLGNEIWVLDLGGEGLGTRPDVNVFDIVNPVAVVTVYRRRASKQLDPKPSAKVFYRRIEGTREEKFEALDAVRPPAEDQASWEIVDPEHDDKLAPVRIGGTWGDYPLLTDIFPFQRAGMMAGRSWHVSPSQDVLRRRWQALLEDPRAEVRAERFVTAETGRNIFTQVGDLQQLAQLSADAPHRPIVSTAWRSFDRQWTLQDPRLVALERPELWSTLAANQIFLVSLKRTALGQGPAVTVATDVPDKHYFRGSYGGKDVMPLYKDAAGLRPNLPSGLLDMLSLVYEFAVTPEDVAAYVTAVIGHDGYTGRFSTHLATPGARVPWTRNAELFARAVSIGRELIWLQTYAQRFTADERPKGEVPLVEGISWRKAVSHMPEDSKAITYDPAARELHVGDGVVTGVTRQMRNFNVSGMNVLNRWLGSRTAIGIGLSATTDSRSTYLDHIRPTEWEDAWNDELLDLLRVLKLTLDKSTAQAELLDAIVSAELLTPDEFPVPTPSERSLPKPPR